MIGFIPVRKRRVGSNLSAVTALLLITIVLTGCLARVGGPSDQDRWLEVFEFEIQPPDLDDGQAAERVADISGGAELLSAKHIGWVESPGGRVDVIEHRQLDPDSGPVPLFCRSIMSDSGGSSGCGAAPDLNQNDEPIRMQGGGGFDQWSEAEFTVSPDVVEVVGTAVDGTTYRIIPWDGFGYVQWLDDRGRLNLVAFDADGNELGRVDTDQ